MEIDLQTLEGEARLLDVPVDSLKDFVSQLNSAVLSAYAGELNPFIAPAEEISFFDLTRTLRDKSTLRLHWHSEHNGRILKGVAEYSLQTQKLELTTQDE